MENKLFETSYCGQYIFLISADRKRVMTQLLIYYLSIQRTFRGDSPPLAINHVSCVDKVMAQLFLNDYN